MRVQLSGLCFKDIKLQTINNDNDNFHTNTNDSY